MKNILIIEDEDIAAHRLIQLVNKYIPDSNISGPFESISQSVSYLTSKQAPDLIFLDIQLADGLSFNIFEKVKVMSPVIFTTAFDEYAIKAFELNSIDYLLKPIDENKLKLAIEKFNTLSSFYSASEFSSLQNLIKSIQPAKEQYKSRFLVSKGDALIPVTCQEIAYFLAEDKIVMLYTFDGKKHIISYSLETLENQLDPALFFRINRHCIVNLKSIQKVHSYFNYKLKVEVLPALSEELIVSKSRTTDFKDWLNS